MAELPLIAEAPYRDRLLLRLSPEARDAAEAALSFPVPTTPLTSSQSDGASCLWLGPDEWLLTVPPGQLDATNHALARALAGTHHAIVDVSHRSVVLLLSGPHARAILAAGCPLDLHPRSFPPGTVARTSLGKAAVTLHRTGADGFELHVERSFRDYAVRFLAEAAREVGGSVRG